MFTQYNQLPSSSSIPVDGLLPGILKIACLKTLEQERGLLSFRSRLLTGISVSPNVMPPCTLDCVICRMSSQFTTSNLFTAGVIHVTGHATWAKEPLKVMPVEGAVCNGGCIRNAQKFDCGVTRGCILTIELLYKRAEIDMTFRALMFCNAAHWKTYHKQRWTEVKLLYMTSKCELADLFTAYCENVRSWAISSDIAL